MALAFGDHRLDIARRELRRGAEIVALEPKAFDLLVFLVQNRDRVVSKDDLLWAVWDGRIVSESALTTRINAVRRALGDDGASQRLVRTVNRKGFRFVGEVAEIPDGPAAAAEMPEARADKPSLTVLPFQNLSGDPAQDYFALGIVEEITFAIARFPWLRVAACHASAARRTGETADPKTLMRDLGVRYALQGSVRKAGNRVRIASELIDTATALHIWGDRFDGTLDDIFDLQDRVAAGVAGALEPKLRLVEIARATRKPTDSLDAYDLYLRSHAEVLKRTREAMAESVQLARRALDLDPDYAPAMARLAISQMMRRNRHWVPAAGPEVEEGICMARRAIAAGGDDPWVLDFAGLVLSSLASDNSAALSAIDRAIVLNPNFATAYGHRALILAYLNRPEEAIQSAQQAIRLSPLDPTMFAFCSALSLAYLALGRYEEAWRWAEEASRENSGLPALRLKLALCGHLGRHEDVPECLRRVREADAEPTLAAFLQDTPKGMAPEIVACMAEGWRKAGLPEA